MGSLFVFNPKEITVTTSESSSPIQTLSRLPLPTWLVMLTRLIVTATLPLLLVLINTRLMMSPVFMIAEYNRPGFPDDPFGMTHQQRLEYGPLGLNYLFNNEDIDYLSYLTFPDGEPLFNERELSHMDDVKQVTQRLVRFGFALLGVFILSTALLAAGSNTSKVLLRALFDGSILTIMLLIGGIVAVALAFEWLFTAFHRLFFEGSTWLFPTSDTLIRLYPEQFWIDAFAVVFGGALIEALLLAFLTWRALRKRQAP